MCSACLISPVYTIAFQCYSLQCLTSKRRKREKEKGGEGASLLNPLEVKSTREGNACNDREKYNNNGNLNRFKKENIMKSIFSDHNGMTLEVNNRRKTRKFTELWELHNALLNNQRLKNNHKEN